MDNYDEELRKQQEDEQKRSSSVDLNQVKDSIDNFRQTIKPKARNLQGGPGSPSNKAKLSPKSSSALDSSAGQKTPRRTPTSGGKSGSLGASPSPAKVANPGSAAGVTSTGSAAATGASTTAAGTTAAGATTTAGASAAAGASSAAAGAGAIGSAGASVATAAAQKKVQQNLLKNLLTKNPYVLCGIAIAALIILMVFVIFSVVDSLSMRYGVDFDAKNDSDLSSEQMADKYKHLTNEYNLDELNVELLNGDCDTSFWDKLIQFTADTQLFIGGRRLTSACEVSRYINDRILEFEDKYGISLSPGHVIATILYAYYNQPQDTEDRVDESSPTKVIESLAKQGLITVPDINTMFENMFITYTSYSWTVASRAENDGVETKKWGCVINNEQARFDIDKYLIFLRYGEDKAKKYGDAKKYIYAKMASDKCCTSDEVSCSLPEGTENVFSDNYRREALQYFANSNSNLESVDKFLQKADTETLSKDEFLPLVYNGVEETLDYQTGFVYKKFPSFKKDPFDEIQTPKIAEKLIESIDTHAVTINQILGKNDFLGEGFYGGNIAEVAIAMYENTHPVYGNRNICYVAPDDVYRPAAYRGENIYQGQYFGTDCNGFVGLVLHEATGIGPEKNEAKTGGDVTFFVPHAEQLSNGRYAAGPRSQWTTYFEKVVIDKTPEEAYELMQIGEIIPGDIVFYAQPDGSNSSNHVLIYVGNTDKGNHMIVDNTGPSSSCGNGQSLNYEPFPQSHHYNDAGVRVAVYRYVNATDYTFGGKLPGDYSFGKADINACNLYNYQIRLVNCTSGSASGYNWNTTMPGGFTEKEINGRSRKVANETIDVERYIKGLITSEINAGYPIEAIKMQMIMAKTYMFNAAIDSGRVGINGTELLVPTGDCFQVYHDYKYKRGYLQASAEVKAKVDEAYNSIKGILIMRDNSLISAQYGSVLQNKLKVAGNNGATFIDMFETFMQDYYKGNGFIYRDAVLTSCY